MRELASFAKPVQRSSGVDTDRLPQTGVYGTQRTVSSLADALPRAALVVLSAVLGACGGTPIRYHPPTEIPQGPGLLTGERGAFVLGGEQRGGALPEGPKAPPAAAQPNADFDEFDAYRSFRRAKSERSLEYREFLEWLEWKRYREWKNQRETKSQ